MVSYHCYFRSDAKKFRNALNTSYLEVVQTKNAFALSYTKGAFKYYVIKEVGGWGQKMAIFDDHQRCGWVGLIKPKT